MNAIGKKTREFNTLHHIHDEVGELFEAVRIEFAGLFRAHTTASGSEAIVGLLRERLEELRRLPVLKKESKRLWKRIRKAEKHQLRIQCMVRAWQNRHDEALVAVGESSVILLASPLHYYRNAYLRERGVQQNDRLADG